MWSRLADGGGDCDALFCSAQRNLSFLRQVPCVFPQEAQRARPPTPIGQGALATYLTGRSV